MKRILFFIASLFLITSAIPPSAFAQSLSSPWITDQIKFAGIDQKFLPLPNACPVFTQEGKYCGRGARTGGKYGSQPGSFKPTHIVMHTTNGITSALGNFDYFSSGSPNSLCETGYCGTGSHFVVGKEDNGKMLQMVAMGKTESEYAQAVGPFTPHISIEMGSPRNLNNKGEMPAQQYQNVLLLVKTLMKQYNISLDRVVSHKSLGGPGGDPGDGWMADFKRDLAIFPNTLPVTDNTGAEVSSGNSSTSTTSGTTNTATGANNRFARSKCLSTKVGNPTGSPQLPAQCTSETDTSGSGGVTTDPGTGGSIGNGGKWRFPLSSIDAAHGIATEMAVYAGGWNYLGHYEHAGLDIGIPGGKNSPVYAITSGTIVERTPENPSVGSTCANYDAGCSVQIRHSTDNYQSRYTHIDIVGGIQDGQNVTKGTLLGYIHIWPNNDHLHFELRDQNKRDSQGQEVNVNPRNFYPELQRFPVNEGYAGNVRAFTANRGYPWQNDGREFGNEYLNHPPCLNDPSGCWAH